MPRRARQAIGGVVYHVLNRGNLRARVFHKQGDYAAFEAVLVEAVRRVPVELFAWCAMPNHWHLVIRPRTARQMADFVRWLTVTHTQRWRAHTHTEGEGHLYQGRYKAFAVEEDVHFLRVCRYVERNALRAGLVGRAEEWRWGSLWARENGGAKEQEWMASWPVQRPRGWAGVVNRPMSAAEEEAIRASIVRGRPYGETAWQERMVGKLGLEHTMRGRGRPRKVESERASEL
jgi:putative transposase